jgi:hypothetical protein
MRRLIVLSFMRSQSNTHTRGLPAFRPIHRPCSLLGHAFRRGSAAEQPARFCHGLDQPVSTGFLTESALATRCSVNPFAAPTGAAP